MMKPPSSPLNIREDGGVCVHKAWDIRARIKTRALTRRNWSNRFKKTCKRKRRGKPLVLMREKEKKEEKKKKGNKSTKAPFMYLATFHVIDVPPALPGHAKKSPLRRLALSWRAGQGIKKKKREKGKIHDSNGNAQEQIAPKRHVTSARGCRQCVFFSPWSYIYRVWYIHLPTERFVMQIDKLELKVFVVVILVLCCNGFAEH